MRKFIAITLVLLMLSCMATVSASGSASAPILVSAPGLASASGMASASASAPGSIANPLITLDYLNNTYFVSMQAAISDKLHAVSELSAGKFDDIYKSYKEYYFAPSFTRITMNEGNTAELVAGASFILQSGAAALTVVSGTVINISTGSEVTTGTKLTQYQRYFCTENTIARIVAESALSGQVDGYYITDATPPLPPLPFIDVFETDWFYRAVDFVYREGVFSGTSANTFSPSVPMTRGMFVTVLYNLEKRPATAAGGMFSDVKDPAQYYYNAVTWANSAGVVTGYPDGSFKPDDRITREQMAVIMYRYAAYKNRDMSYTESAITAFPDASQISDYALTAVSWAVSWRIINGSDGKVLPKNTAARSEVAQIILNYCERIGR